MKPHYRIPLVRLPADMDQTLYLIREELKSRKLFHALHEVGIDDCYFQPHLDSLILRSLGIEATDATFEKYNTIMNKRSKKIEADLQVITRQAIKVHHELTLLKKEMQSSTV